MLSELTSKVVFSRATLTNDFWGGLAAMLVALPSAIAFGVTILAPLGGTLAAQGALAGILGATALALVAPSFGGSSRLITAPCAPAAAVLSALALTFSQQGTPAETILLMLGLIGLLSGAIQIGLGLAGIGRLIKFIPFPVVSGYLSGVGLIIIGSQIPKFLGVANGTALVDAVSSPGIWSWPGVVVGAVAMATMVLTPRLTRTIPAAILALVAGVACYQLLGAMDPELLTTQGNPLLVGSLNTGDVGLADSMIQHWKAFRVLNVETVSKVLVPSLTLAVLLSIDTLKTCVVIDAMTKTHHDSNRELVGQGLGNIASSMIGGVPGAGTMGASLINISSGGTSRASGLMCGVFSLVAFLLLAPLIAWIPVAALAAILMVIGYRMIDQHSLHFFFTPTTRLDFVVIVAVILVAIFVNLIAASGVGVALAMMLFIREQTRSSVVRNRIDGPEIFSKHAYKLRDTGQALEQARQAVVFELQGSLFFGTASQLQAALEPEIGARTYVILSMRRVQSLDVTATHVLEQIKDRLEEHNAYLVFCDIPKGLPSGLKMKRFLKETGVVRPTNKAFAFRQLDEALEWVETNGGANAVTQDTVLPAMALADSPLLRGISSDGVRALSAAVSTRPVRAGDFVFKVHEDDNSLFIVRSGSVKVTVPIDRKESYHLATIGPGELIGGMGFLESSGHVTDALALTDVEVYVLAHEDFDLLAKQHGDLALSIVHNVALNLSMRLRVTIGELQALRG
ncbi:SulP family inorganic anion transporter [Accumulibacter sp.]|uniref:SulP family inorganic anion transporter n=1 Tax=Accumulibacter sp. TaxID=2053492 RepID=UPI002605521F|nr:SulP family inorganic anion transporter [Accumulibacter sp.]